jgi:hypothetical protein
MRTRIIQNYIHYYYVNCYYYYCYYYYMCVRQLDSCMAAPYLVARYDQCMCGLAINYGQHLTRAESELHVITARLSDHILRRNKDVFSFYCSPNYNCASLQAMMWFSVEHELERSGVP